MSNTIASPTEEGPSTTSSTAPPPSVLSPSYTFSADAVPFIPSFMRAAPTPAPQPAEERNSAEVEADEEDVGEAEAEELSAEGSEQHYRQHFSKTWMLCLEQMQGQEVGMLMEMMPLDIQDLYFDKLSDEYLHHDHEHKDTGVHALRAAQKMVLELSPEQLTHIEEFLVETDALNPAAKRLHRTTQMPHQGDGDDFDEEDEELFMNDDEDMGQEEEEWLLEQMMAAAAQTEDVAAAKQRK